MEGVIGIATEDFALFHDLVRLMRERGQRFVSLRVGDPVPSIVSVLICSPGERHTEFPRVVKERDAEMAVIKALSIMHKRRGRSVVMGIDPGEHPGYALMLDGTLLMSGTANSPEDLVHIFDNVLRGLGPENIILRIGHGDPVNRDRAIRALWHYVDEVQVVDERSTSGKTPSDHVVAAKTIASNAGERLSSLPKVSSSKGGLRNIKRISRCVSGNITISSKLAEEVAQGRLSMDEAIKVQRLRNGS